MSSPRALRSAPTAGADALRIWEGDLERPEAAALLDRGSIFVTAGGRGTGADVGDTTPDGLRRILHHRPQAVLLNDPTLLTGAASDERPASHGEALP